MKVLPPIVACRTDFNEREKQQMADLTEVLKTLSPEPVGEVDYNAPEPGSFPPQVKPGVFDFQFKLNEKEPFGVQKVDGKPYFQVCHDSTTVVDGEEKTLTYQRASFYKHPKMPNSMAADLIRSLDVRAEGSLTPEVAAELFEQASNQGRHFRGEVGWRFYCDHNKNSTIGDPLTISTHPRKKKGDIKWPQNNDGSLVEHLKCPKCGRVGYGNADIVRYLLPGNTA